MTPADGLLDRLRTLGVSLRLDGDRLRFRAPQGVMTPELLGEIKRFEPELLVLLDDRIPRLPERTAYELSHAQRRLWVLHQLDPASAAYHIPLVHELEGQLDGSALAVAFDRLAARHDALRTTIRVSADTPFQYIGTSRPVLDVIDMSDRRDPDAAMAVAVRDLTMRPFDLEEGPLVRVALLHLSPARHVLVIVLHHLVADGVSVAVLMRELAGSYAAVRDGRAPDLPPLPVQYSDYAAWQNSRLEGPDAESHRQYWLKTLAPPLRRLDLPADFPRPATLSSAGAEETFALGVDLVEALRRACRRNGATLFMGLVAAVKVLVHRYTGADDVIVGTPSAGRHHVDLSSVVGVFINTLVLRDRMTSGMTFTEVLGSVRRSSTGAFDHAEYPFDRLVQDLDVGRDPSRAPVFDVMVILQNQQTESFALPGVRITPRHVHTATSKFDLTFNFHEHDGAVSLGIEYRTALFTAARIRRLAVHFEALLRDALEREDVPIGMLTLLSAEQRAQLVRAASPAGRPFPLDRTVLDLIQQRVGEDEQAVAVGGADGSLTYGELDRRSTQIARHLLRHGVKPGTLIGVALGRSPDMVAALLGVLKCGAAYTPIDPAHPADRLRFQMRDAGSPLLLTEAALVDRLPPELSDTVLLDSCAADLAGVEDLPSPPAAAAAYVIYTSGSTGVPKGVLVTHRNLTNLLLSMAEAPGVHRSDVLMAVTTLSFDIAGLELYLPLIAGARVEVVTEDDAREGARLARRLDESGATIMQATPATWRMLLATGWQGDRRFKVLCGGELMPDRLARDLIDRAGEVWNLYGPTETTIWSLVHRVTDDRVHPHPGVPIGTPIANTTAWLFDAGGELVPRGHPGDLYLGGEGVAQGYVKRPDLTADRFVPNPFGRPGTRLYRTGDRAVLLEDGAFQFIGRDDHQVKVRGFRVELGEIESALREHESIRDAVVIATDDEPGERSLIAYVTPQEGAGVDTAALRTHVAQRLPPHAVPSLIVGLDRLPLTPGGKVDRRALPAPDRASAGMSLPKVGPRDQLESAIAEVWASVLSVADIGIHDNFFELGGHSLRATRATYLLQSTLGLDVLLVDIFKAPTVAELAAQLRARRGGELAAIQPLASPPRRDHTVTDLLAPMTAEEAQLLGDL